MADPQNRNRYYTEEQITKGLMGLVMWGGQVTAASKYLEQEQDLKVSVGTLSKWRERDQARYDRLREEYAGQLEGKLASELRDTAILAVSVQRKALAAAEKRLDDGKEADPARAAANLAQVVKGSVDKLFTVTSRPTVITEQRGIKEILRSLIANSGGAISIAPELEAVNGTAVEDVEPMKPNGR